METGHRRDKNTSHSETAEADKGLRTAPVDSLLKDQLSAETIAVNLIDDLGLSAA